MLWICGFAITAAADEPVSPASDSTSAVSFHNDVKPIFVRHCYGCHQGAKQLGSYSMTDFASLVAGGETEQTAIVPGNPDASFLIQQITPIDGHAEMPDEPFKPLSDIEIDVITRWIAAGAVNDSPADAGNQFSADHPPTYAAGPAMPSIDVSPDGNLIAVAGFHEVVMLDATSHALHSRLIGLSPRINTVRFSPDGRSLAVAGGTPGQRGELQVWDVESANLRLSLPMTFDTLCGASWSPDGSKIAFGANDNVVRAVDSESGQPILFQGAHEDWVRDTGFTPDGKHLISVARDMSCKLTEVETERFVDNITSITPGALSGGLNSVAVHPVRNEIVIGGADGIAKVYRVFRETERKIGDDANLIRSLPKLDGRISCVAISQDATRIAAAATIDGHSEIRVWQYSFDGDMDEDLRSILSKRVNDRNAEEKKKVDAYRQRDAQETTRVAVADAAVYAITFAPDNSLLAAANDGNIRHIAIDGTSTDTFPAVQITADDSSNKQQFDVQTWIQSLPPKQPDTQADALDSATAINVTPSSIRLGSLYDYTQLIVTAVAQDGSSTDITAHCQVDAPPWMTLTNRGLIRPIRDGAGSLTVHYGSLSQTIPVSATGVSGDDVDLGSVDYIRDVAPVLSRLGCNQGTCHGAQKGKNGFRLSLRGYDPEFDLRALTDDLSARRINAAAPEESLMLRKPLGTTPHQGGTLMTAGDPYHAILRRWIADGSQLDSKSSGVSHIEVFPINPIVQSTKSRQQVRVVAHYSDGTQRDVTREAFIESGNTEVATADNTGLLSAIRRGEAPILARFEGAYAATTLTVMGDRSGYQESQPETWSQIDELVAQKWHRVKVEPSGLCDDATFLRRVHLDLTGMPPTSDQVRAFLADETSTRIKRGRVIDDLIGSEAYIEFWTNKWSDLLLVNRKFLGVEGSTQFRQWIRDCVANNMPYDHFAQKVLTAAGSNNENPPASYFKTLRTPEDTMENTTHLFLGIRFNCNKCHDHPFERWTQDQYYEMASFFAQVGLQRDPASGDRKIGGTAVEGATPLFEKVVDQDTGDVMHPRTGKPVVPTFPYDVPHDEAPDATRRQRLADWITDADNPYFARSYANRLWGYLLGVGLIEPIDDIRAGNPPTNPELLDHLTNSFVESNFDVASLLRQICNSRTYQLDIGVNPMNEDDRQNYSHALPRRLPAEVIYDTVHTLTGSVTHIPGVPAGTRAAELSDSGVKLADGFLQNLGRPTRESACECERSSELQLGPVMALISGPTIGTAIADPKNELGRLVKEHTDDRSLVDELFLRALGRMPSDAEFGAFQQVTLTIQKDHRDMVARLAIAEDEWSKKRIELEKAREAKLADVVQQIAHRSAAIQPERKKLESERAKRIETAQQAADKTMKNVDSKIQAWQDRLASSPQWHPLLPTSFSTTNQAVLTPQPDRSIIATGPKGKGVYHVAFQTSLPKITGFRLEAIADASLPSSGPGLGQNGNFVVTEIEVSATAPDSPKKPIQQTIASAHADFAQGGFAIEQTFDGKTNDQRGWAVSNQLGVSHWATFQFAKPIANPDGVLLSFDFHQFHNATDHRLGRFRISVTTDDGDIGLSEPEAFAAILATPASNRSDQAKQQLVDYLARSDSEIQEAKAALAEASKPVPPDDALVALENRKAALTVATPDTPSLIQKRMDVAQSAGQLDNLRLTAAEDLTWALINSPAFLFNR
ncbi:DUF1549 domain-containing protein [Rubripirellula lacrimiformis]|nr:DUF1549 domain-containing protein [Rubripirellula lacrimiformis]